METIYITQTGQGEHFLVGTDVVTIKASGQETSGQLLVLEVRVPPGGGPPVLHRHQYAETFYILEGEFEVETAAAANRLSTRRITAGDTLSIPSMVWHNFKNVGAGPARFVVVHAPAVMESFIREIGRPISDPLNPPKPAGPPSDEQMQKMMGIIMKYMEVLPAEELAR
ncbi:MAG: cupin domain-containing protein [Anaerolineales bacterium]|nr:cupin domain-containing protein [Anaerolineales bacterium]